jgi:hypothetical protein
MLERVAKWASMASPRKVDMLEKPKKRMKPQEAQILERRRILW